MTGLLTQYLKNKRIGQVIPFLKGNILDLGCGDAPVLAHLPADVHYTGIDSRPAMVEWLEQHYPTHFFQCRDLDREALNTGELYDSILMMAVIEHLKHPERIISQAASLLKPGGRLIITTPTVMGDQIHQAGAYLNLFSKEAADEHQFIFNQATLKQLLEAGNLEIVLYRRFLFGQNQLCVAGLQQAAA